MNFEVGQTWISEDYPHEDFIIYIKLDDEDVVCWKKANDKAFREFIKHKKGMCIDDLIENGRNTYPYAYAGECSSKSLKSKIKKYNMKLR